MQVMQRLCTDIYGCRVHVKSSLRMLLGDGIPGDLILRDALHYCGYFGIRISERTSDVMNKQCLHNLQQNHLNYTSYF